MSIPSIPDPSGSGMLLPAIFISDKEKTFQYDEDFPSLPVPPLKDTLNRYLESVQPHLSEEEFLYTRKIINEFGVGVGKELHEKLMTKAKHARNWLDKWWHEYAYLYNREPHAPFVNFAGPCPSCLDMMKPEAGTQIPRAALWIWIGLKYWENLRYERLTVDKAGLKEKKVWSMSQFRRCFNGCKTPGEVIDQLNIYFKTASEGHCPTHFVVLCKGRIFRLEGCDQDGAILTVPEIEQQLREVEQMCNEGGRSYNLGALTGHRRTDWFKARQHLLELSPMNGENLKVIETAINAIVLDDHEPTNMTELSHAGLCGDSTNRWLDKSYSLIFFKNGTLACNCDHSPMDAMVMVSASFWTHLTLGLNNLKWQGSPVVRANIPKPKELHFVVDSVIDKAIQEARVLYQEAGQNIEIFNGRFHGYGREALRRLKVHPDTHVQVAIQYAYYKAFGKPAPTYETASTRQFYNGRTETVRSCTMETLHLSKTMLQIRASIADKVTALKAAYDKHNKLMTEAQDGQGCDRHLLGLQLTALESGMETPALFKDPAFTKSGGGGHYILSTSFIGYTPVYGGVAPMCKDGYGIFYAIHNDGIVFFISCWKSDVASSSVVMYNAISEALNELMQVLNGEMGVDVTSSNQPAKL